MSTAAKTASSKPDGRRSRHASPPAGAPPLYLDAASSETRPRPLASGRRSTCVAAPPPQLRPPPVHGTPSHRAVIVPVHGTSCSVREPATRTGVTVHRAWGPTPGRCVCIHDEAYARRHEADRDAAVRMRLSPVATGTVPHLSFRTTDASGEPGAVTNGFYRRPQRALLSC